MGPYAQSPAMNKGTVQGTCNQKQLCKSDIQGWRILMEDRSICQPDLGDSKPLFGVLDGHEGNSFTIVRKGSKSIFAVSICQGAERATFLQEKES